MSTINAWTAAVTSLLQTGLMREIVRDMNMFISSYDSL